MPPLRLLTTFAAVVRAGSMQAAAAELNVSQPSVSQAIKQLEGHVGARLIDRTRRPVRPTPTGNALARAIEEGISRIDDALQVARAVGARRANSVTVACSVGVATYWLMPRLAAFYRTHPDTLVNVDTTLSGVPALSDGTDLAIRFGHGRWTDGLVRHLFDERVEPVCSPARLVRTRRVSDVETLPLLHVMAPEASWLTWDDYFERTGRAWPSSHERMGDQSFTNYVQTTQSALDGHGMMLGWRSITGDLVDAGRLVAVGLPPTVPPDAFYLVSRFKRDTPASETLAHWLVSAGGSAPPSVHAPTPFATPL